MRCILHSLLNELWKYQDRDFFFSYVYSFASFIDEFTVSFAWSTMCNPIFWYKCLEGAVCYSLPRSTPLRRPSRARQDDFRPSRVRRCQPRIKCRMYNRLRTFVSFRGYSKRRGVNSTCPNMDCGVEGGSIMVGLVSFRADSDHKSRCWKFSRWERSFTGTTFIDTDLFHAVC